MNLRLGKVIPMVFASFAMLQLQAGDDGMKPNGCKGPSLCHAYPEIDSNRFHFDIGFLVEQMRITDTEYALYTDNTYNTLPQENVGFLRPDFDLEWGLTCGLGYYFMHDDWFLEAKFDWLRAKGKNDTGTTYNRQIVPLNIWKMGMIAAGTDVTYFTDAKSTLTTDYFNLDVDLNKGSFLTGCFCFEPHAGLQVSWIYYQQNSEFRGAPSPAASFDQLKRRQDTDFWGIGPQFGLDSMWHLAEGFSFFADNAVSILFGQTKMKDKVTYQANVSSFYTNVSDKLDTLSPAVRSIIGFQYDRNVYCEKQHVMVRAGLDTRYYWNQYNHINAYNENPGGANNSGSTTFRAEENGSFGMIGLLIDFGWDF